METSHIKIYIELACHSSGVSDWVRVCVRCAVRPK